jgi:hypothetical protein
MNRLKNSIAYICGPIDALADRGVGWRGPIIEALKKLKVGILNPLDKSVFIDNKISELHTTNRKRALKNKDYRTYADIMKEVVRADLAMVDKSDFLIVYIDKDIHMCGSYHEIAIATLQRKPILILCKQGIDEIPPWLWGVVPHEYFFSTTQEVVNYLKYVSKTTKKLKRWRFFDIKKVYE